MSTETLSIHPLITSPRSFYVGDENKLLRERVSVVALVLILHAGLGGAWLMRPEQPPVILKEMSVSIAMQQLPVVQPQPLPEPPPPTPQPKIERTEKPIPKPVVQEVAEAAPQPLPVEAPPPVTAAAPPVVAAAPVVDPALVVSAAPVVDTEPDYKASYLNNPRPTYPMVARRMGWEGKVILNVEVLAEGACGAVNVFRSSGREVLDKSAMAIVKTWRFTPARRAGRPITQWFQVPINFSLEENEA